MAWGERSDPAPCQYLPCLVTNNLANSIRCRYRESQLHIVPDTYVTPTLLVEAGAYLGPKPGP